MGCTDDNLDLIRTDQYLKARGIVIHVTYDVVHGQKLKISLIIYQNI